MEGKLSTTAEPLRVLQAKLNANKRWHADRPDIVDPLKREIAEAKLAEYIRRVVDQAPPLTAAQRDRLALLLRGDVA